MRFFINGSKTGATAMIAACGLATLAVGGWLALASGDPAKKTDPVTVAQAVAATDLRGGGGPTCEDLAWDGMDRSAMQAVLERTRSATHAQRAELEELAMTAPRAGVRAQALRSLGRLGLVRADSEVAALLNDPNPRVRQEVVTALGRGGDPATVSALKPLLSANADPTLRALAIQALGRIGTNEADRLVRGVLEDSSSSRVDRAFARGALAELTSASASAGS